MESKWPFVAIRDDGEGMSAGDRWDMFKAFEGAVPPETLFIREDAARAWQAFRDWCDGTPEQWRGAVSRAWLSGRDYGREDVR